MSPSATPATPRPMRRRADDAGVPVGGAVLARSKSSRQQPRVEDDDQREGDHDHDAGEHEHLDVAVQLSPKQLLVQVRRQQPVGGEVRRRRASRSAGRGAPVMRGDAPPRRAGAARCRSEKRNSVPDDFAEQDAEDGRRRRPSGREDPGPRRCRSPCAAAARGPAAGRSAAACRGPPTSSASCGAASRLALFVGAADGGDDVEVADLAARR